MQACSHTPKDGHHLTFHAKPQETKPCGLLTRPLHLLGIPLVRGENKKKTINPLQIQSHICPESQQRDNREGEAHKEGRMHLQEPQLSVTSFSNDRHGRWHEIDAHVPRASRGSSHPLQRHFAAWLLNSSTELLPIRPFPVVSYYISPSSIGFCSDTEA